MRKPPSRLRDPDFIVIFQFAAAFICIPMLVTGGSETYLYLEAQQDPLSRLGLCTSKSIEAPCVTLDSVNVVASNGDDITLQYVGGSQQVKVKRIGGAEASAFPRQDEVIAECYQGDIVALSDRKTGALMKLENYPEPPLRFFVPEVSLGLFCLFVWVGLYFYRRYLFKVLVITSDDR
ncbi:MAG TPA: hypothetical protein VFL29_10500 [Candidatus Dormibacteraeota bacterium]|nr:hypothetical protein [Candidatus Dormibacteraeota bacterium]